MTTIYRTAGAWGSGKGSPLTAGEVDENFYGHETRLGTLEGSPPVAVSIASITQSGNQFTVHLTDGSLLGPFAVTVAFNFRDGGWQPSTHYAVNDWFTANGSLYTVLIDHTSSSGTFDANATDGSGGGSLYGLLLSSPANVLPTGGAARQNLKKSSGTDFAVMWGWDDAGDVTFQPSTGSSLVSTNVADALEEIDGALIPNSISSPSIGQVLTFNGTDWDNEAGGATTLADLTDTAISAPSTGQVLTFNGTKWDNEAAPSGRFSAVTALGTSGSVSLDPTLGDVFTIAPTADVTITPTSYPAGAHIILCITTANNSGFKINFGGNENYDGDLVLPKQTGVSLSITFVGDGSHFWEVARTADRQAKVLGTTGTVSVSPTFGGLFTCTPTADITFTAAYAPVERKITIVITTSGTTSRTMTFGTNFKSQGTLATGIVSGAVFTVMFIGDGTNFNEVSRTTAM